MSTEIYCRFTINRQVRQLTEDPPPVHSQTNIKLNTGIFVYFMYVTCNKSRANLKLTDNPAHFASHIDCTWRAVLTDFTTESGSFWTEAANDVSEGKISAQCRYTNFNWQIQI